MPLVVRRLVDEFGATRIVLFGSLARDEATPDSDVDLLVQGIAPARFFDAQAVADRILAPTRVDLVPVERARPLVRERAAAEGEPLYG